MKKYRGSLSGEHGDGRLRGEFISLMLGEKNYELLKSLKKTWDPHHMFNPGKIIDTPPMNSSLRYIPGKLQRKIDTYEDLVQVTSPDKDFQQPARLLLVHVIWEIPVCRNESDMTFSKPEEFFFRGVHIDMREVNARRVNV